jgi:DNA sulfur modification protein DndD
MGWSRRAGFSFGKSERTVFNKVCSEYKIPARLVEQLIELEVSEQRNKNATVVDLVRRSAQREDHKNMDLRELASENAAQGGSYRIQRLSLVNFCVFAETELSLRWQPDRPLCIVEGNNGYGKTKLIEALRFVLYGAASGINLASLLHRDAEKPRARLEISLELSIPDGKTAKVRRFIEFAVIIGHWKAERQAFVVKLSDRALQDDEAQEWVDARLPQHVMECFVFDAERSPLATLGEGGTGTGVAEQLERVLGVGLLRDVAVRVKKAETAWRKKLDGASERKSIRQARAALEEVDATLERLESDIRDEAGQIRQLGEEKSQVSADLTKFLNQFDPAAEEARDKRIVRREILHNEEEKLRHELVDCVGRSLPIQLLREHITFIAERSRSSLQGKHSDSFSAGLEHAVWGIARLAAEQQLPWKEEPMPNAEAIAARLLQALNVPKFDDQEDFILPESTVRQLELVVAEMDGVPVPSDRVDRLRSIREELSALSAADSPGRKGVISPDIKEHHGNLLAEQSDLDKQLSRREITLETLRKKRDILSIQHDERRRELELAEGDETRWKGLRIQRDFAGQLVTCIRALADRLRGLRVDALEQGATEMFRKTTNKPDLYARIVFDRETLRYHVCDHQGNHAPIDRSTGERAVLSLAIVHGLRQASGRELPLVVEAPLKPLDPVHTDKVIRHAFQTASGQTILLLKPEEIPAAHQDTLVSRTGQRFVLQRPDPHREISLISEYTD